MLTQSKLGFHHRQLEKYAEEDHSRRGVTNHTDCRLLSSSIRVLHVEDAKGWVETVHIHLVVAIELNLIFQRSMKNPLQGCLCCGDRNARVD